MDPIYPRKSDVVEAEPMDRELLSQRVIECREKGMSKHQSMGHCLQLVEYRAHLDEDDNVVVDQEGVGSDDVVGFEEVWGEVEAERAAMDAVNAIEHDTKASYVAALREHSSHLDPIAWAAGKLAEHGVTTWPNLKKALAPDV